MINSAKYILNDNLLAVLHLFGENYIQSTKCTDSESDSFLTLSDIGGWITILCIQYYFASQSDLGPSADVKIII